MYTTSLYLRRDARISKERFYQDRDSFQELLRTSCDGKKKTPFTEGIEKFFTTAGFGSLGNFEEVINWLSQHLSVILHCVLLQSRKSKGVTKPSQNLFLETNHTREDFGKIILKYLHQCRDDKEISKALNCIKFILLYLHEEAVRKTPCDEISGNRCTDVVLTENNLKCLFEVLTELTWQNKECIKEDFERDECQKLVAFQRIFECIRRDFCGGSKGSSGERQKLGELIMNLKNSFNPDVNSVFCEQFTDYRESEVNFEALSFLADCLSDILHQLLLQEAGLTEFFEKSGCMGFHAV